MLFLPAEGIFPARTGGLSPASTKRWQRANTKIHGKNPPKYFAGIKKDATFASAIERIARALSSAGSEYLVYTQRVGGSNPSAPTRKRKVPKVNTFGTFCLQSRGMRPNKLQERNFKRKNFMNPITIYTGGDGYNVYANVASSGLSEYIQPDGAEPGRRTQLFFCLSRRQKAELRVI